MDEKTFFLRLKEMDSTRNAKTTDIRQGVWEKIARAEADECELAEYLQVVDADRPYLYGLGIAAALAVVVTSSFLYAGVIDLARDMAIKAPYMELFHSFY